MHKSQKVSATRKELLNHDLYESLDSPEKVRIFMQQHVFAVWDFMSLLKRLQRDLTCVEIPWTRKLSDEQTKFARFINEIVIGEETDEDGDSGFISHFGLYLEAMKEAGAETFLIENFLGEFERTGNLSASLKSAKVPNFVAEFVENTIDIAVNGKTHEVCAAFFFGREEIIPDMFQTILDELETNTEKPPRLAYYLRRHIELDGDEHGPLAEELLEFLCGNDERKIKGAEATAVKCLQFRINLWQGILEEFNITAEKSLAISQ